jgi:glycine cleavage system aminomethyltransferase T
VAVIAASEGAPTPLVGLLAQAGAVFAGGEDQRVVVHYGSAAGELAVCVSAVGLVNRSDLSILVIEAPPSQLAHLTARMAGGTVAPGGALQASGAWWCGAAPQRTVVVSQPHLAARLRARLRDHAVHYAALTVKDVSDDWVAIELLGRAAARVLRALGAYGDSGDARQVSPFTTRTIAGIEAQVLLESDNRALLLVPTTSAAALWQAIEQAGRPAGISCVGLEAASRYALLQRTAHRTPLHTGTG